MMVATPVAPTPAPQNAKAGADSAATPEGEGGFATLLQLLGLAEPPDGVAETAPDPLAQAVLQTLDGAVPTPDPQSPLVLPFIQPLDIKAAQLLVRQGESAALPGLNATPPTSLATLSAEDIAQALQSVLNDAASDGPLATPDPAAPLPQPATLPAQVPETASTTRTPVTDSPVPRQLHAEVGTPAWSDELGARLQLLTERGHHAATLRLSPEHLGPLEVQISVQDNEATVWFGANHADTRAALEQALPRLRELFAAQGLSLSQSGVFQESSPEPGRTAPDLRSGNALADGGEGEAAVIVQSSRRGLVDAYA